MRIFLMLILFTNILYSQDAQFSQMETAPILLNPALAGGIKGKARFIVKYRSLWNSILKDQGYQNYFASAEFKHCLNDNFIGGSFSLQRDQLGSSQFFNTNVAFSLSYHHQLDRDFYLSAGFNAGFLEYGFDPNSLQFDEQFDGIGFSPNLNNFENFTADKQIRPNIDLGLSFYNTKNNWIIGLALLHVNQPNYSLLENFTNNRLGIGLSVHGAITFDLGNSHRKSLLWRGIFRKQALFNNSRQWQFQGGTVFQFNLIDTKKSLWDFSIGLATRLAGNDANQPLTIDALIPSLSFTDETIGIHFSYDTNVSSLAKSTMLRGAMEVTLTLELGKEYKCEGCPRF